MHKVEPVPPARPRGAQGHQPRRSTRAPRSACIGAQRLRQVLAAADHGRRRRRLHRRGPAHARLHRGPARAGAPPRPGQGRHRQRHGRRRRGRHAARALRRTCLAKWADPDADYEKLGEEQADLEAKIEASGAWDLKRTIEIAMDALRLPPSRRRRRPPSPAASAAASPCAGCCSPAPTCCCSTSPPTTSTPSRWRGSSGSSRDYEGTVVAITHDRYFLDNVAGWILELDHGKGIPFEGNYSSWLEQKQERLRRRRRQESARARTLAHELEWVRMAPKARQAKGKARLAAYEQLLAESQAAEGAGDKLEISIPPGDRLGDVVIEAEHLSKGFGDRLLIDDLSFSLPPAGIVGVIGPNGAGKTTLFRMITGAGGARRRHAHASAPPSTWPTSTRAATSSTPTRPSTRRSPTAARSCKLGSREMNGRAYVASFNFKGSDQQKKVGVLSGGERNRVHLAKVLARGRQRAAARRAHQRPRRRHPARARGRPRVLRRLRRGHQPRPLVPRPRRHPHARLRGRLPGAVVRGQLQRVRGVPQARSSAPTPTSPTASSTSRWCDDHHGAPLGRPGRRCAVPDGPAEAQPPDGAPRGPRRVRPRHRRDDRRVDRRQQRHRHHLRPHHRGRRPRPRARDLRVATRDRWPSPARRCPTRPTSAWPPTSRTASRPWWPTAPTRRPSASSWVEPSSWVAVRRRRSSAAEPTQPLRSPMRR